MCTRIKNDVICECVFLVFVSFALNMMLFKKPVMQVVDIVILLCISILLFIFHLSSGLLHLFRAFFDCEYCVVKYNRFLHLTGEISIIFFMLLS